MESPHRHSPELQKLTSRTPPLPIYGGENRICDRKSCNFSNVKIFFLNRATKALEAGFNEIIESGGEALQYCPPTCGGCYASPHSTACATEAAAIV